MLRLHPDFPYSTVKMRWLSFVCPFEEEGA